MKKTLITTALACGLAFAAAADDTTTYSTTNSASTTVNNAWFNGFTFTLDSDFASSRLTTTATAGELAFADQNQVSLDSITVNIRSVQGTSVGLALTNASGMVLTVSDNSVTSTGNQTWTFTNTSISTTEQLYFVYFNAAADAGVSVGTTLTAGQMVMAGGSKMIQYGNQTGVDSLYMLGNNQSKNMSANKQSYAPMLTIATSSIPTPPAPSIPEPATATLSLLALAGIAVRRRRK